MKMTYAKCTECNGQITVDSAARIALCNLCFQGIETEKAISRRNAEIMLMNPNLDKYREKRIQKGVASIISIFICLGSWQLIQPEMYRMTADPIWAIAMTAMIAIVMCNITFRICTK